MTAVRDDDVFVEVDGFEIVLFIALVGRVVGVLGSLSGIVGVLRTLPQSHGRHAGELLTDVVMVTRFTHLKFLVYSLVVITSYLLQSLHLLSRCQSLCSYLI